LGAEKTEKAAWWVYIEVQGGNLESIQCGEESLESE